MDPTSTLTGLQRVLKGARTAGGLDVIYTKLAIDLQNLEAATSAEVISACLDIMRDTAHCDVACLALFDDEAETIAEVSFAQSDFTPINADKLVGAARTEFPWLSVHLDHLRLIELNDTAAPDDDAETDAGWFKSLSVAAGLFVSITVHGEPAGFLAFLHGQPIDEWDADHKLLMKLMGSSLTSGLERMRYVSESAERDELRMLVTATAHDGMWDFDALANTIGYSPQWKKMMGYSDA